MIATWVVWLIFILLWSDHDALNIYYNDKEKKGNLQHGWRVIVRVLVGLFLVSNWGGVFDVVYVVDSIKRALPLYAFFWIAFDIFLNLRRTQLMPGWKDRNAYIDPEIIFYVSKKWWGMSWFPWYIRITIKIAVFTLSIIYL